MKNLTLLLILIIMAGCGENRVATEAVMLPVSAVESLRAVALNVSNDRAVPVNARMSGFHALLESFLPGTSEDELSKYLKWDTKSSLGDGAHSLHVVAPDGSDYWLTLRNGKLAPRDQ